MLFLLLLLTYATLNLVPREIIKELKNKELVFFFFYQNYGGNVLVTLSVILFSGFFFI